MSQFDCTLTSCTSGYTSVIPSFVTSSTTPSNTTIDLTINTALPSALSSKVIDDMKKCIQSKSVEDKVKINGKKALEAKCPYCYRPLFVLPEVKEVENYNNRVVLVRFMDDTWTKAVYSENDEFDIDVGITVCILKKILGGQKEGTRLYNSYLENVHKKMRANKKAKEEEIEKEKKEREKQRKYEMKRKAKQLKAKEEQIDIVKQGFERAIQERDFS